MDMIPPLFLRTCAETLFLPIFLLLKNSLSTCTFPDVWKVSKIVPIYKSGSKASFLNYRPVSIISVIPKLFEAIVVKQLSYAFKHVIDDNQHGFLCGKSVESNLFIFVEYLNAAFAKGADVHTIYTDFSKAFDRVNHELLIFKLEQYGVGPKATRWLHSYLSNRSAQVCVRNSFSRYFKIISGVPQGSHMGPLLFLIFINDIGNSISSRYLLFADDLKLFYAMQTKNDQLTMQHDLESIHKWCLDNDMSLNLSKCKALCFSKKTLPSEPYYHLYGVALDVVYSIKDLGVLFDAKLSFSFHYDMIVSKASRMLGLIQRICRDFTNIRALCTLYFGLVRSVLDYCCVIWSPFYKVHVERIERIQSKFLGFIKYKLSSCYSIRFRNINIAEYLGILDLASRRDYLSLIFFFKILSGYSGSTYLTEYFELVIPQYGVRANRLISFGTCKSVYQLHCPQNRVARLVNSLHLSINLFNSSLPKFKSFLHQYLLGLCNK